MEAILAGAVVLAVGVLLAFCIKRFSLGDSVTFLALMLLPLIAYGVVSGKVQEFTAPGGWGAKFHEVAEKPIDPVPLTKSIVDGEFIAKGDYVMLEQAARTIEPGEPIALTLQLGRGSFYVESVIREYIRVLSASDPEMSVVIIDAGGKYVASSKGIVVAGLLDASDQGQQFMAALRSATPTDILNVPGFTDKSISDDASNVEALEKMERENTSRLVAVTANRVPRGIVLRDMIVARLLVGLASDKK